MEQSELFEDPRSTHKPTVHYYHCGQGLIFRDEWRYFSFALAETKDAKRKRLGRKRRRQGRKDGKADR